MDLLLESKKVKDAPLPSAVTAANPGLDTWLTPGRFAGLLALLILAAFPQVLLGSQTFFFRDYGLFGYPLAHYHRESFWNGEIPLWNPLSNCGIPFLAQWNTMVLYPPSLFYLLLPLPWSLGVFCLLHIFLAGLGMYFLARHWTGHALAAAVAGISFAFSGFTMSCLIWPSSVAALAWMPWVLWLVQKGWRAGGPTMFLGAAAGAVQMLAGSPEFALVTWLLLFVFWVGQFWRGNGARRAMTWRAALMVLLVIGMTAAQMLPFLDLLRHSQRDGAYGGANWAMPPWGWASFLVPLFRASPVSAGVFIQAGQAWTSSYYLGIGAMALALLACWRVRRPVVALLGTALLASVILALGDEGYLYAWVRQVLPQVGFMRYPVKIVVVAAGVVPLLTAFAISGFLEAPEEKRAKLRKCAVLLGGSFAFLIIGIVWFSSQYPSAGEDWRVTLTNGLTRGLALVLILATLYALSRVARPQKRILLQGTLLLLVWLDLFTHAPRQNPTVDGSAYTLGLPPVLEMKPRPALGESRVVLSSAALYRLNATIVSNSFDAILGYRMGLSDNCNLLEGFPKIGGFYPLYFPEEQDLQSRIFATTNTIETQVADFLGASQITSVHSTFAWTARSNWMPMITGGQKPEFLPKEATVAAMLKPDFDPRKTVFLSPAAQPLVTVSNETEVRFVSRQTSAHRVTAEVEAAQPSLVVVAQAFYHPWRAQVDGVSVPIWRANHAFQALAVPAGRHQVTLVYDDRQFIWGAILSALTWAGCLASWLWTKRVGLAPKAGE